MKKIISLALVAGMAFTLCSCGGKKKESYINDAGEKVTVEYVTKATADKFEPFEKGLTDAGLTFEKKEKAVGAISGTLVGYMYTLNDGRSIELYKLDYTSDAYRETVKSSTLYMSEYDVHLNAFISDEYALIPNNYDDINAIFEKIK